MNVSTKTNLFRLQADCTKTAAWYNSALIRNIHKIHKIILRLCFVTLMEYSDIQINNKYVVSSGKNFELWLFNLNVSATNAPMNAEKRDRANSHYYQHSLSSPLNVILSLFDANCVAECDDLKDSITYRNIPSSTSSWRSCRNERHSATQPEELKGSRRTNCAYVVHYPDDDEYR